MSTVIAVTGAATWLPLNIVVLLSPSKIIILNPDNYFRGT